MLCGCLFPALVLWAGEPGMWLRPHMCWGDLYVWDIPPASQLPPMGLEQVIFACQPFLPVSMWLLLPILGYEAPLQPVFSWLFRITNLYFCCYTSLVLGGSECIFHLFWGHLGSPLPHFLHVVFFSCLSMISANLYIITFSYLSILANTLEVGSHLLLKY